MNNKNLTEVYKKIENDNISVFPFTITNYKAATIEQDGNYGIFIDKSKIENSNQEFEILAHEYGHCKSGATHKLYSPHDLIEKHEYMADRTAILEFSPFEKLQDAFNNGCQLIWQIAEFLSLPDSFIEKAVQVYQRMEYITI